MLVQRFEGLVDRVLRQEAQAAREAEVGARAAARDAVAVAARAGPQLRLGTRSLAVSFWALGSMRYPLKQEQLDKIAGGRWQCCDGMGWAPMPDALLAACTHPPSCLCACPSSSLPPCLLPRPPAWPRVAAWRAACRPCPLRCAVPTPAAYRPAGVAMLRYGDLAAPQISMLAVALQAYGNRPFGGKLLKACRGRRVSACAPAVCAPGCRQQGGLAPPAVASGSRFSKAGQALAVHALQHPCFGWRPVPPPLQVLLERTADLPVEQFEASGEC